MKSMQAYKRRIAFPIPLLFVMILFIFSANQLSAKSIVLDTNRTERPKVGLVFSGGGAKGFAHIGALKVIRDAGIEVDYIAGTSMGSIVGGLYAIGYSPEAIAELVSNQNWADILLDKIERRDLSLEEKSYNEQQFISFPVTKNSVSLPFGIKYGQSVSLLLSSLVTPVNQYTSFNEFQTPFLCIATDISNGQSVIIDKGNLADAMRASMAIPTVFTPVILDGKLLVDGGLVNNFPAKELAERGCDIIIGVDVQKEVDYKISDLSSITSIINRSAGFYREALNDTAMNYVDYYIQPDITGYGIGSFGAYDSIMMRGEKAATQQLDELQKLGAYLKTFPDYKIKKRDLQPLTSFILDSVVILGNTKMPTYIIKSVIPYDKGEVVELSDVEKVVKMMYGSLFFNTVKYSLKPGKDGLILFINVEEASFGSIGLGIHYDTDYKAGILITSKFRNVLFKNTLLELTLGLSENPYASLKYHQNRGLLPGFGMSSVWTNFTFIDYQNGKDKIGQFRFNNFVNSLYVQFQSKKTVAFGGGVQLEFSGLYNDIGIDFSPENSNFSQTTFNFFAFLKVDRWDKSFFPHRGGKVYITSVFVTEFLTGGNVNFGEKVNVISGEYDKAIPLSSKWTFRPRINAGFSFGEGEYFSQLFLIGGQGNDYLPGMVSFNGLNVAQLIGNQMIAARLKLQYRFFKKHYILATVDMGNVSIEIDDIFNFKHGIMGYGLSYGYDSFVGPLEISIMGSNYRGFSGFLNLGFWF